MLTSINGGDDPASALRGWFESPGGDLPVQTHGVGLRFCTVPKSIPVHSDGSLDLVLKMKKNPLLSE
jgi:hypothetical protein